MRRYVTSRSGVTRVGVLVVLIVASTLGGVLVVAVQRARFVEANHQTKNNLKQCALAIHSFHDNYKSFPGAFVPGGIWATGDFSLWFHLRPFSESSSVYVNSSFDEIIPVYLAPSDPTNTNYAGALSFAANLRVFGHATFLKNAEPVDEPGKAIEIPAGAIKSGLRLSTIADGTESTVMLTTRYVVCAGQKTLWAAHPLGGVPVAGQGGFMGAGSHDTPATREGPITAIFQLAPSEESCLPQAGVFGHSFGSHGISIALCDGSVRNIGPEINPLTFGRALCPGDGEQLGGDWKDD